MAVRKKTSCALIGFGFWGKIFLAKLQKTPNFELMAIASRSASETEVGSAMLFRTPEELFLKCNVDLVFILGSVEDHLPVARLALAQGSDVFLTKPLTRTLKEAEELKKLARAFAVKIFVDHTFLFNSDFQYFENLVGKAVGGKKQKIKNISSQRVQYGRYQKSSDVLGELLYHDIYMALALARSKVVAVHAFGSNNHDASIDQCALQLEFKNHVSAELFASMSFIQKQKIMNVITDRKIISWKDMEPSIFVESGFQFGYGPDSRLGRLKITKSRSAESSRAKKDAIEKMLDHISVCKKKNKKSPLIDIDQGLEIMRIIQAARKSVAQGRKVRL